MDLFVFNGRPQIRNQKKRNQKLKTIRTVIMKQMAL